MRMPNGFNKLKQKPYCPANRLKYVFAAGILTVLGIVVFWNYKSEPNLKTQDFVENLKLAFEKVEDEEKLTVLDYFIRFEAMGFEGRTARNIDELLSQSPVSGRENEIQALPVFKNPNVYDDSDPYGINEEDYDDIIEYKEALIAKEEELRKTSEIPEILLERADEIQKAFGLEQSTKEHFSPSIYGSPESYYRVSNKYTINVDVAGNFTIDFDQPISMPEISEEFNVENFTDYFAGYLKPYLKSFLGFENFDKSITSGYDIYGGKHDQSVIYPINETLSLEGQFLLYEFNQIQLYCAYEDDADKMGYISNNHNQLNALSGFRGTKGILGDMPEIIGVYPIISTEQAEEEFKKGNFLSSVQPTEEELAIARVQGMELTYFKSYYYENFVPVYQLYVTFENGVEHYYKADRDGELDTYVIFYVPAIEPEYVNLFEYFYQYN